MYSAVAQAMDRPSNVEVPRPISSRISRLLGVAKRRMEAISLISTMKVDWPAARSSEAPTRVKIRSHSGIFACAAGTKLPMCASSTIRAT